MTRTKQRERYRSELRAEILVAARELILEEGYSGLSIRKLAKRMDYSPMALYSYFTDKHAILTALALEGFEALAATLKNTAVQGNPFVALREMLLAYIALYAFAEDRIVKTFSASGASISRQAL